MTNDDFRKSIIIKFSKRKDIKTKAYLGILMRRKGYFNAENPEQRIRQTQLLLNDAWYHLNYYWDNIFFYDHKKVKVIKPKNFEAKQIRDLKTGRIVKWIKA